MKQLTVTIQILSVWICAESTANNDGSYFNQLTFDLIGSIKEFLSNDEQRESRFINKHFNRYYDESQLMLRSCIDALQLHAASDALADNETLSELKRLHQQIKFNELYLRILPTFSRCCFRIIYHRNNGSSWMVVLHQSSPVISTKQCLKSCRFSTILWCNQQR